MKKKNDFFPTRTRFFLAGNVVCVRLREDNLSEVSIVVTFRLAKSFATRTLLVRMAVVSPMPLQKSILRWGGGRYMLERRAK